MCGRYYVEPDGMPGEIARIIEELNRRSGQRRAEREVRPTEEAPVVVSGGVAVMRWGFTLPDRSAPVINARSETAAQRPMFSGSVERARCLIPAGGYFEWRRQGKERKKYRIGCGDRIWMAGLYRREGNEGRFCILTREAVDGIAFIHDRMPLIAEPETARAWLNGAAGLEELVRRTPVKLHFHAENEQLSMFGL